MCNCGGCGNRPDPDKLASYKTFEVDLTQSRQDVFFPIGGKGFNVHVVNSDATIRINSPSADPIPLRAGAIVAEPGAIIEGIYITNDAGNPGSVAVIGPIYLNDGIKFETSGYLDPSGATPVIGSVQIDGSTEIVYSGAATITAGSPVQVGNQPCREVTLKADTNNTTQILVGHALAQLFPLDPGESLTLPVTDLNVVWLDASGATADVFILARN